MKSLTRKITLLITIATFSITTNSFAQNSYNTAIGLRAGGDGGITVKHFISASRALEGILSRHWQYGGMRVSGLYEIHKAIPEVIGLNWYYGGGAHIGFYNGSYYGHYGHMGSGYFDKNGNWHPTGYQENYLSAGIDGIIGIEYKFEEIPFTIGLDIKPYFDFVGATNNFGDGAISFRYILK